MIDIRKQFRILNNKERKRFEFISLNNSNSFTVSYFECDSDEINAEIVVFKALRNLNMA